MKEALSDRIVLHDVDRDVFRALLVFIHTDTLQADPDQIMDLLMLANQYTLTALVKLCEAFLCGVTDPTDNAASLYSFADLFDLPNLKACVLNTILRSAPSRPLLASPPDSRADFTAVRPGRRRHFVPSGGATATST